MRDRLPLLKLRVPKSRVGAVVCESLPEKYAKKCVPGEVVAFTFWEWADIHEILKHVHAFKPTEHHSKSTWTIPNSNRLGKFCNQIGNMRAKEANKNIKLYLSVGRPTEDHDVRKSSADSL